MNLHQFHGIDAGPACAGPVKVWRTGLILGLCVVALGSTPPARAAGLSAFQNGKIAFASKADGDLEIYSINADGTGRTQLTFNGASDTSPVWSPDGKRIAYASNKAGNWDVYVMKSDGTSLLNVTGDSTAAETAPTWSLDGHKIAFTSTRTGTKQIFVQELADLATGGAPVQITSYGRNQDPSWGIVSGIERIFFTSNRDGDDEIFSILPSGLGLLQLTNNGVPDQHPRFSRSGEVYYGRKEATGFRIWRMSANGAAPEAVPQSQASATSPAGAPDGESIAFVGGKGRKSELFVADAGGGNALRLTNDQAVDAFPDWQVIRTPSIELPAIYDVEIVPHGIEVDVLFKTSKSVTAPVVELYRGAQLERFQLGSGSGKTWAITVSALDPATSYDLQIVVATAPGKYVYYEHPAPVTTLRRKVTFTARYAFVINDSDPSTCGDVYLGMQIVGTGLGANIANGVDNACSGFDWNFANKRLSIDDVTSDTLTIQFNASDDDTPIDSFEKVSGRATVELVDYPEAFTKTVKVRLDTPDPDSPGDLYLDVTFDYRVEYHP